MVRKEVKDPPILLDVGLRIWFESMYHVWKFHTITDEKYREVVAHKIKIALRVKEKRTLKICFTMSLYKQSTMKACVYI